MVRYVPGVVGSCLELSISFSGMIHTEATMINARCNIPLVDTNATLHIKITFLIVCIYSNCNH